MPWSAQLAQRVQNAVKDLALAQPLLLRHALALVQIAADREGAVARSGDDGRAHGGTGRDCLQHLDQARRQFRRDRVVGVRPIERDDRHASPGDVLDEHDLVGLHDTLWRAVTKLLHSCFGAGHLHVRQSSVRCGGIR